MCIQATEREHYFRRGKSAWEWYDNVDYSEGDRLRVWAILRGYRRWQGK